MGPGGVGRRVTAAVVLWALVFGGLRLIVLLPEDCPTITVDELDASVAAAVGWFATNQKADGTWLYRYDRAQDEVVPGYNTIRHSGVTMSLYQAAAAGDPTALAVADAGATWALDNLLAVDGWTAFEPGDGRPTSGASALLVAGLAQRRESTGDETHDDAMRSLATFLTTMTTEDGAVHAEWDPNTRAPVPEKWSQFYTGETFWALALMEREMPDEGWGEVADRIGRYIATERDEVEGNWPEIPDHWAAYGFEVGTVDLGATLDDEELEYVRRQAAFGGIQARYESQRSDDWPRWRLRGRRTLAAGLGTVGEQLGNIERISIVDPRLGDLTDDLDARARCVAGMLVDRQVAPADADDWTDPERVSGAWFQFDVTQMDDQQHAMSALLLARPLIAQETAGSSDTAAEVDR